MTRDPLYVVTASGSYHSKLFVAWDRCQLNAVSATDEFPDPIMEVSCLPIWVVSGVKRATICIELIREYKLPVRPVSVGCLDVSILWCVLVNETKISIPWQLSNYMFRVYEAENDDSPA
jgi:hypothetical protein